MSFPSRLRHKQLLQAFYLPIILPNIFTVSVSTTISEGNNHMNAHSGQVSGKQTMVSHDKLPKIYLSVKKSLLSISILPIGNKFSGKIGYRPCVIPVLRSAPGAFEYTSLFNEEGRSQQKELRDSSDGTSCTLAICRLPVISKSW